MDLRIAVLVTRWCALLIIIMLGVAKLSRVPRAADGMWRPRVVSAALMHSLVIGVAVTECAWAIVAAMARHREPVLFGFGVALGLILTMYGIASIVQTSSCGCAGGSTRRPISRSKQMAIATLFCRNVGIFGLAMSWPARVEMSPHELSVGCLAVVASPLCFLCVGIAVRSVWAAGTSTDGSQLWVRIVRHGVGEG